MAYARSESVAALLDIHHNRLHQMLNLFYKRVSEVSVRMNGRYDAHHMLCERLQSIKGDKNDLIWCIKSELIFL